MITSGFKNVVSQMLSNGGTAKGLLPIKDISGTTVYLADYDDFPYNVETTFTLNANNAGVSVGSGTTTVSENDYQLVTPIASGLMGNVIVDKGIESGNAYITLNITVTNTSNSNITIAEICYKQEFKVASTQSGTTTSTVVCMVDRSLLETPITISPNETAVLTYKLKAILTSGGGTLIPKTIIQNGIYDPLLDDADGYSLVTVNVPSSTLVSKIITTNGVYDPQDDNADGYSEVSVSVSPNVGTKSITQNGTYNALSDNLDGYSSVEVNVSGGGGKTQINPFPQGATTITLYNSNGVTVNSSSIGVNGTGQIDFDESSAGYEGMVIELNVTANRIYKVEFDYQNIDAQYMGTSYMIGWLLENTARTTYSTYSTWSNDIARDSDLHHHAKIIMATGNHIYMNFNLCGYSDNHRNNVRITNLKVYEYSEGGGGVIITGRAIASSVQTGYDNSMVTVTTQIITNAQEEI